MKSSIGKLLLLSFLCLGLARCGGEGKISRVKLAVVPKSPIIITADGKDANGNTITAPWFSYRLFVTNGPDEELTIVAVKATITYSELGSAPVDSDFSASNLNYTTAGGTNCDYLTLGEFAKGQSAPLVGMLVTPGLAGCQDPMQFSIAPGSLPKSSNPNSKNYRYRVEIKPQGWFGTRSAPNDRFEKKITVYTQ